MAGLAGILGGAAALTRYVGVALVPAFLLGGVFAAFRHDRGMRWRTALVGTGAACIAAGILLVWMWRNYALNGSPLGPERSPSELSYREVLGALAMSLGGSGVIVALPLAIALALGKRDGDQPMPVRPCENMHLWSSITVMGIWAVIYLALLLWQEATIRIDHLNDRLMFPAYGCGLLIGLLLLEATSRLRSDHLRRLRLVACLVAPLLLLPGVRVLQHEDRTMTPVESWVAENTTQNSLLIGHGIWGLRYATRRTVLESGAAREGTQAVDGPSVSSFLQRHGANFDGIYVLVNRDDCPMTIDSFRSAGIGLTPVYAENTHTKDGVAILQVQSRPRTQER